MTVAVLPGSEARGAAPRLDHDSPFSQRAPADFELTWFSGTGCGGQHRNKHQNSARIVHLPSGLVRTAQTRSRENSRTEAMGALLAELDRLAEGRGLDAANAARRLQLGSGERSDRRRLWAFQRDRVEDLLTGRSIAVRQALGGALHLLW